MQRVGVSAYRRIGVWASRRAGNVYRSASRREIAKVARYEVPGIEREKQPVPAGTIDHLATVGWYWKPKCDQFYRPSGTKTPIRRLVRRSFRSFRRRGAVGYTDLLRRSSAALFS